MHKRIHVVRPRRFGASKKAQSLLIQTFTFATRAAPFSARTSSGANASARAKLSSASEAASGNAAQPRSSVNENLEHLAKRRKQIEELTEHNDLPITSGRKLLRLQTVPPGPAASIYAPALAGR